MNRDTQEYRSWINGLKRGDRAVIERGSAGGADSYLVVEVMKRLSKAIVVGRKDTRPEQDTRFDLDGDELKPASRYFRARLIPLTDDLQFKLNQIRRKERIRAAVARIDTWPDALVVAVAGEIAVSEAEEKKKATPGPLDPSWGPGRGAGKLKKEESGAEPA